MFDQNSDLKEKPTRVPDRATQDAIALLQSQRESEKRSAEPISEWDRYPNSLTIGSSLTAMVNPRPPE